MYWRSLGTSTREPTVRALEVARGCSSSRSCEGVGHGDELGAGVGGEGLLGRAGASAAAADQADLDRAAAGGVDQGNRQAGRNRRRVAAHAAAVEPFRKSRREADTDEQGLCSLAALRLRSVSHGRSSCGGIRYFRWESSGLDASQLGSMVTRLTSKLPRISICAAQNRERSDLRDRRKCGRSWASCHATVAGNPSA